MKRDYEELTEVKIPQKISERHKLYCDICMTEIKNNKIGVYSSDVDICNKERKEMGCDILFCEKCNPHKIRLPHLGITEIISTINIEKFNNIYLVEKTYIDEINKSNEGIVWRPLKVWQEITRDITKPEYSAYVSEFLYQANIPIENIIQNDGSLNRKGYSKEELHQKYVEYIIKII